MRAVLARRHGPPETLVVEDLPPLSPSAGEVVVYVHASAVNFPDTLIIEDKYQIRPPLPFSPGSEVAGTVKAVGEGVSGFAPGDRVIAACRWGGYAEEVVTTPDRLVPIPAGVAMDVAASLLVTYGTTHYALQDRARLRPGETLLVLGAAGGTGLSAIELGKLMGARVIAAASSEEKLALCRERGADDTILYTPQNLKDEIRKVTDGRGVDVVYDPVGGDYAEPALRGMAWGGRYLVIGFTAGIPKLPLNLPLLKGCSIVGVFYGAFARAEPQRYAQLRQELVGWLAQGRIRPAITARYPLEQAVDALKVVAARKAIGKIVLTTRLGRGE
ncbi:NADPH:quinone oxidoreductase family protein [Ramlibacter henchirensis]|uniref:NADPH:quinone oxidoreductase family protein n=1 Tax=Ramlibacter henchirensis TaxID=204072 RepID=A0A4Z0BWT8_9BURK|nr:NADPH:quinone oxidoreductase family protein [Ramlibacter henchirensis]TFZ02718.1 NADPH:quinone oxidoreductase family protein [Ramlibacter henchirensis]